MPDQILKAVQIYTIDCYGVMISPHSLRILLQSLEHTCVKLTWNVPRSTFTYLVENVLALNFVSLRNQAYARYVNFFNNLFRSSSKKVRHLARIVLPDDRSVTSRNVNLIKAVSGLSPWDYTKWRIKEKLPKAPVPDNDEMRRGLLSRLLTLRQEHEALSVVFVPDC